MIYSPSANQWPCVNQAEDKKKKKTERKRHYQGRRGNGNRLTERITVPSRCLVTQCDGTATRQAWNRDSHIKIAQMGAAVISHHIA